MSDLPTFRDQLQGVAGLTDWPVLQRWGELLQLVRARRSLPAGAPLLTVLVGPTGVGKSTLFNQFLGRTLSATGAVRPCTYRPLGVAAPDVVEFFANDPTLEISPEMEWNVDQRDAALLGRQALVDTPDFDSVASENRRAAERLCRRADRVIAVLSPAKYADANVWETLESLRPFANVTACVFNKAQDGESLEDCARLLAEFGLPPPLSIPRLSQPDDLHSWHPDVRRALLALVDLPSSTDALLGERRKALESWEAQVRDQHLAPWLDSVHAALEQMEKSLVAFEADLPARVQRGLRVALDKAMTREFQERFLESIQKYDILREPRRWISAPFRWVGEVLRIGPGSSGTGGRESAATSEWLVRGYSDRYLEFLVAAADELRALTEKTSRASHPPLLWPAVADPQRDLATESLRRVFRDLQVQIEQETEKIARGISTAGKIRFYGSQVVFNVLMLSILIQTGGGLTLGDLAAQGLISPYGAKLFAKMVSADEAAGVQRQLEGFLAQRIAGEVAGMIEPLRRHAATLRQAVGTPAAWREAVHRWESGASDAACA